MAITENPEQAAGISAKFALEQEKANFRRNAEATRPGLKVMVD